ncbi:DNA-directed DNA polymerase [Bradyrhizobium sp. SZCCHNR2009]|uniref:DNA polymerase III subunit beta n=1 Tax=Bradyrhizobium sp. SZCCHNR2009 TaxID=3057375 RepID=UPI0028E98698|nr:DNA-directed DNA polymerase [Bradyrhizobium sp. SZCCHNR2009]
MSIKLKINRDKLAEIVTRGVSSAPKNSPAVIANNARIVVKDGMLHVATTDFQMQVEASGECNMEREGATTVDASKLKLVVDRLPKGADVTIDFDESKFEMIVKAGRSRTSFPTLAPEDWPARQYEEDGASFTLDGTDLVRLLSHTAQELSTVPNSPMQGVFFHVTGGRLAAVGTTGMILIMSSIPAPEGVEGMPKDGSGRPGIILSAETASQILRLFRSAEEVQVVVNEHSIFVSTPTTRFCSSLLLGTYPNYAPLVSNPCETRIILQRDACASAVALLEPFALKDQGYRLQCAGSDEGFVVAVGSQTGGGVDVVEADINGEVAAFGLNGQFMKTMLGSFKASTIALHPDHQNRRVLFQAEDEPSMVGVIGMMNISTEMAAGPKHG